MKKLLVITALSCLSGLSSAATIVQTENFSFAPLGSANLVFDKFDTLGGTLTLTGVTVRVTYTKLGGDYFIDNDSGAAASADIIQVTDAALSFVGGNIFALADGGLNPIFTNTNLDATVSRFFNVDEDNGDYAGGPLVYTPGDLTELAPPYDDFDGGVFDDVSKDVSGNVSSLGFSNYIGAAPSTFTLNFDASTAYDTSNFGGIAFSGTNPVVSGSVIVTYTYIPEPSTALFFGLAGAATVFRRRRA